MAVCKLWDKLITSVLGIFLKQTLVHSDETAILDSITLFVNSPFPIQQGPMSKEEPVDPRSAGSVYWNLNGTFLRNERSRQWVQAVTLPPHPRETLCVDTVVSYLF